MKSSIRNKEKIKKIKETLESINIKNETQMVETRDFITGKPRFELRNYYKLFTRFLLEIPDSMLDTELNILKTKVENKEFLKELE